MELSGICGELDEAGLFGCDSQAKLLGVEGAGRRQIGDVRQDELQTVEHCIFLLR